MGGDGQALTNSRSLLNKSKLYDVEGSSSPEKENEVKLRGDRWTHCKISLDTLESPAVFDMGGCVYSKLSVVNYLLERKNMGSDRNAPKDLKHLKKLSDVREISNQLTEVGFKCPITGFVTSSGLHSFSGFWGCGHVVGSSALHLRPTHEEKTVEIECPVCGTSSVAVKLVLPPTEEEEQRNKLKAYFRAVRKRPRSET